MLVFGGLLFDTKAVRASCELALFDAASGRWTALPVNIKSTAAAGSVGAGAAVHRDAQVRAEAIAPPVARRGRGRGLGRGGTRGRKPTAPLALVPTLRRAGHCMLVVPALAALGDGFGIIMLGGLAAENEYRSDAWILQL